MALNLRKALPNARFIGFTGTPLIDAAEQQLTRQVFGDYVSIYDFQRAVADGATLPLFYENRGEELKVVDPTVNERIEKRIDTARQTATLDDPWTEEKEEKLYRELARDYPVLTSPTRLDKVAQDFVDHYHQRWRVVDNGGGKAMLVCLDKITCVAMASTARLALKTARIRCLLTRNLGAQAHGHQLLQPTKPALLVECHGRRLRRSALGPLQRVVVVFALDHHDDRTLAVTLTRFTDRAAPHEQQGCRVTGDLQAAEPCSRDRIGAGLPELRRQMAGKNLGRQIWPGGDTLGSGDRDHLSPLVDRVAAQYGFADIRVSRRLLVGHMEYQRHVERDQLTENGRNGEQAAHVFGPGRGARRIGGHSVQRETDKQCSDKRSNGHRVPLVGSLWLDAAKASSCRPREPRSCPTRHR
jgi:hypothetical protein